MVESERQFSELPELFTTLSQSGHDVDGLFYALANATHTHRETREKIFCCGGSFNKHKIEQTEPK